jgi:hypothetical protein
MVLALGAAQGIAMTQAGATGGLHATASPTKNVKPGKTITVKVKGAHKGAKYYCAVTILSKSNPTGDYAAQASSAKQIKASKKGTFTCKQVFKPFSGISSGGTPVTCPVKKSLAKKYTCAIGVADVKTQGQKQSATVKFTAKK